MLGDLIAVKADVERSRIQSESTCAVLDVYLRDLGLKDQMIRFEQDQYVNIMRSTAIGSWFCL